MNTNNTLTEKFIDRQEYPIWYYKELEETTVDYVISYLLKETFVVDIEGIKHEITFGHNKEENYIGQHIRYSDIQNLNLSSYEVIERGFKEGKWFTILDKDTTEEFKQDYLRRKTEYERKQAENWYRDILITATEKLPEITKDEKELMIKEINTYSYEKLEEIVNQIFSKK